MSIIDDIRADHEDLAKVLKKHTGIRRTVEDLYPDSAHFIFELLQNAEDTGAKHIHFYLKKDALIFAHDGRAFNERDIKAITDIGEGSKSEDSDTIGQFGIGFKAVFAYTESPRVWSPTYSFEIKNLVLPYEIESKSECGERTCFEFPFNNPKKNQKNSYDEVKLGLEKLPVMTLLFLSSIESIQWQIEQEPLNEIKRIEHNENHIELQKILNNTLEREKHFLRFSKALNKHEKQYVSIAFNLEFLNKVDKFNPNEKLSEQMKIVPASPGRVSVYFPAEKEISGLRFHLHAPFVPELSRASIKDTPINNPLYSKIAELTVESLSRIKDLQFLTSEFLSILPNNFDELSKKYIVIRETILDIMNNENLTPTYQNNHLPANLLCKGKASLKKLLTKEDLNFLLGNEKNKFDWAVGAANNSLQDRFLSSLNLRDFSINYFVSELDEKLNPYWLNNIYASPDEEDKVIYNQALNWLNKKNMNWHQQLYAFFYNEDIEDEISDIPIIKLYNGGYDIGENCFFVDDEMEINDDMFQIVHPATYSSGKDKKEQDNAKDFLKNIGVKEINEVEKVKAILEKKYRVDSLNPDLNDMKYFIDFFKRYSHEAKIFKSYYIFQDINGEWKRPCDLYFDTPFENTGLNKYFKALKNTEEEREKSYKVLDRKYVPGNYWARESFIEIEKAMQGKRQISKAYLDLDLDLEKFVNFAEIIGVQKDIEISEVSVIGNPDLAYLKGASGKTFTSSGCDKDYTIVGLKEILKTQDKDLSLLIWKKITSLKRKRYGSNYFEAIFKMNQSNEARYTKSLLFHILSDVPWVPQNDESFVKPSEASVELLPDGFSFDSGQEWLKLVNFGEETQQKIEKEKEKEAFAKEFGFESKEDMEKAQELLKVLSPDDIRAILDNNRKNDTELPDNIPRNPDQRVGRVGDQAENAPEDTKSQKKRSVSDYDSEVKKEADDYLRHQYTNIDGEMICQICSQELPFKKANGEFYFEKVKFIPKLQKLYYQNYLALCPNHAAMYKVINNSKDELLKNFKTLNENENELEVLLGNENMKIYFTKTHILDMKTVINTDEREDIE